MYQTINEKIAVKGFYRQGKFTPQVFEWRQCYYSVGQVTMVADVLNGGVRWRYYSLVSRGNVYRVGFNRDSEQWILEEIWME